MNSVFARLAASAAVSLVLAAPASALSAQDRDDLARVSAYLNSIESMTGSFVQIGPQGQADTGKLWLLKPGRMRFEYAPPNPNLIVAGGGTVAIQNAELRTVDRYPLTGTPLAILLDEDVNLADDANIVRVSRAPGQLTVVAREDDGPARGELTLVFTDPGLQLRQWTVKDAQGLETTIALQTVRQDVAVDPALFVVEDIEKFGR